ncbi:MAG: hypothetical protein AAF251_07205 [Pseudomonadota bacterium]
MTLSASLLLIAQAATGALSGAADASSTGTTVSRPASGGAVASATASARVLRPVSVRVKNTDKSVEIETEAANALQTQRDTKGTLWIEFS